MAQAGARAGNCTYAQDCNWQGLPFDDLLKMLIVEDANGCWHINTVLTTADCDTLTGIPCPATQSLEEYIRKTIVQDDCGRPALSLFYHTSAT